MRIDVVTIFPEYLRPLELSLVGRARRDGLLDLRVHDLRTWATDRHRTVDDTPFGGGAGMVMRPDVWGEALDSVLAEVPPGGEALDPVLAEAPRVGELLVPSPAGETFTQRLAEELAHHRDHLVIACGRYEGIDARVAEHYRARGVRVREVSIGDYVLNGGEAAALVVVEAVARLLPGVVGNPDSLVEESHGTAGLLEYPVYTKPATWRGVTVPPVLLSGDHARIARWRQDQALDRTARRRPDMLDGLDPATLDPADRARLARSGWVVGPDGPRRLRLRAATAEDATALAELAARTFPLACPAHMATEDVEAFVATHLSVERMRHYARSERHDLVLAEHADGGPPLGYALTVLPATAQEGPAAPDAATAVPARPAAELSKCYVLPGYHGSGLATALTEHVLQRLEGVRVDGERLACVWLGTNRTNRRARAFYRKLGFRVTGRRSFRVGERLEDDVVMVREVTTPDVSTA